MQNNRSRLIVAFGFTALFLLAFVGTTVVGGFGQVSGVVRTLRTGTQILGGLAAVGFLVSMVSIAIAAALQPGSWPRKLLYALPAYGLGFILTGVVLALLGIGTTGTFIGIWLAVGLVFSLIVVAIAAGRMKLSTQTLRTAMNALGITSLLSLLAWAVMVIVIVMVLINPPQAFAGVRNGAQQSAPASAATPAAAAPAAGQAQGGEPRGPGGRRSSTLPLIIGGAAMTLFLALELWIVARGRRAQRAVVGETSAPISGLARADYGRETGRALLSCVAITVVAWGLGQLVPVSHSNPPPQTAIQWDSPQTQSLAKRACMDCHSDETAWPWYTYIAPGSWLTVSHVNGGRSELNFSELNNLPAFRKANLSNQLAETIRSGAMPPKDYLMIHPTASLTAAEKEQLIQGLQSSLPK